ncbi:type II toxin-antitoxin system Rv0910 family toxin [Streptomyces chartreusis]|uniref:type II toxin-antitoxin system Rv0910 family toxin n=1 Tax=Streptomyces chartreusis TaxID=1969 RepID=UPI003687A6B7
MGQLSASREIAATPSEVWAVIANPSSYEQWLSMHQKWKGDLPAELTAGAKVTEVISMMGMPNTIAWNVDKCDAPTALVFSGEGMAGVKVELGFNVSAAGSGTLLEMSCSFEGQMIVGALGKAVEKQGAIEVDSSLTKLTELLGS